MDTHQGSRALVETRIEGDPDDRRWHNRLDEAAFACRHTQEEQVTETVATRAHLTIADVCAELGVARSTFYDWRAARKAPRCIKLPNGDIRIRRVDLERWLKTLEDMPA